MPSTDKVQEILESAGIKDFDDLTSIEKESYFKMLEIAQAGQITLEDYKKHIKKMKDSVSYSLAVEDLPAEKDIFYKARLKCYLLMEAFFEKPERAQEMLELYGKGAKKL